LEKYVENGEVLVITPFTGYQTWDGVFRSTGFAADLSGLTRRTAAFLLLIH